MANDLVSLAINLPFVDEIYAQYTRDPNSVDATWRNLFERGEMPNPATNGHYTNGHHGGALSGNSLVEVAAFQLVDAFRAQGHVEADVDPLGQPRASWPELDPLHHGVRGANLDMPTSGGGLVGGEGLTIRELVQRLRRTYCGHVGVELLHIVDPGKRRFLVERIETVADDFLAAPAQRRRMFESLASAEALEVFVHTKFIGSKRFSLEGGDTLLPLLHVALDQAGIDGVEEAVLGMAHRGRLNVLVNLIGKRASELFAEFEDIDPETMFGGGDVKYHMGFSSDYTTQSGQKIHLSLAFNPSHLEAVNPVVMGRVRAKQRRRGDEKRSRVLGILIHGDAAFAGQGLVPETLNLSQLQGYKTGGTLNIIVNNQIGFTTLPKSSRSTPYCSDVAKLLEAPIFHVNGDDPDAVAHVVRLAMDYRREWKSDVVIDMVCFRRYGHNETDEPGFTQPLMYQKIEKRPSVPRLYGQRLAKEGVLSAADVDATFARATAKLDEQHQTKRQKRPYVDSMHGVWAGYLGGPDEDVPEPDTGVDREALAAITRASTRVPSDFAANPKVVRLLDQRQKMGLGEALIDWGMGEQLAFGSLLWEGRPIRFSGQDSRRGTFSQRHAVVIDSRNENEWIPLNNLREGQANFRVYDSPLSEAGVLGFEYGYSLDFPEGLVIWEAQFGDFVNGAQVIIDQFITSCEDKWKRLSGLVMLLPHGFEGQGPEHSSARFERFLELSAEDNIQVCYPSTPAQYFHMLRRQVVRKWRKPLVVMTPKSLLRLPKARSPLEALTQGKFERILHDDTAAATAVRLVLCTGKLYYELDEERQKRKLGEQIAIARLEQLYPLSDKAISAALQRYPRATEIVWAQEEPANMGAQRYIQVRLQPLLGGRHFWTVSRVESASPATGSHKAHQMEQTKLIDEVFAASKWQG